MAPDEWPKCFGSMSDGISSSIENLNLEGKEKAYIPDDIPPSQPFPSDRFQPAHCVQLRPVPLCSAAVSGTPSTHGIAPP
jgi:hypothetical protein